MIERITAEQAREMMKPNERGEEILRRLYPRIRDAAQKRCNHVVINIRVTQATFEWVMRQLVEDGYVVKAKTPNDIVATHCLVIRW